MGRGPKVLIVGLDGATFDLIKPWALQRRLPNFSYLLEGGVHGELRSTIPPLTCTSWASFATGCNPGKHGIYDFREYLPGSYDGPLVNSARIGTPTIWDILNSHGKRVGLINVPLTYPPPQVNGFVVSGVPAPNFSDRTTFPAKLASELGNKVRGYEIDPPWDEIKKSKDPDFLLNSLAKFNRFREEATFYFLNQYDCDLFMVVFMGIDRAQHFFWDCLDSDHPASDLEKRTRYGSVILDFYQRADSFLGRLLERIDEDTVTIVVSDHGGCAAYELVYFDRWLIGRGLMKMAARNNPAPLYDFIDNFDSASVKSPGPNYAGITSFLINKEERKVLFSHPPSSVEYEVRIPENALLTFGIALNPDVWSPEKGEGVLFEVDLRTQAGDRRLYSRYVDPKNNPADRRWFDSIVNLSKFQGREVLLRFATSIRPGHKNTYNWAGWSNLRIVRDPGTDFFEESSALIDWSGTKAYWGIGLGIRVNLKGREPQGLVDPGYDYEKLRDYIIKKLKGLKKPGREESLLDEVFRREELYSGRYLNNAPDLIVTMKNKNLFPHGVLNSDIFIKPSLEWGMAGGHSLNGILMVKGKNIKRGTQLKNTQITDLAPTILRLLDVSAPQYMDGRVLTELFEKPIFE